MHFMIGLAIFVCLLGFFPRIMGALIMIAIFLIIVTISGSVPHH